MNRLKVASWVATFVLTLASSGWASQSSESVLTAFMEARIAKDIEVAYPLLSDEDRAAVSLLEWFTYPLSDEDRAAMRSLAGPMGGGWDVRYRSFSISQIEQAEDTAEGVLEVEIFDARAYRANWAVVEEALDAAATAADREAAVAAFDPWPTISRTETVGLRRESSGWHVHLNLRPLEPDENAAEKLDTLRTLLENLPGTN